MRYFRCLAGDETYEQARLTLDAAWGHPNAATKTITCIDPAAVAPRDQQGRIMLAVSDEFCGFSVASEMIPVLLDSGAAEEIAADEYISAVRHAVE
jgi:hypothetical protein